MIKNKKSQMYKKIGLEIRRARQLAGMAQIDVAKKLGYKSATYIHLIEAGKRKISIVNLDKLSKVLCRTINFFLGKNEKIDIRYAISANEDLSKNDQEEILRFIEFKINQKKNRRRNDNSIKL